MTRKEKIEHLAKAVMTLGELGDNKTACVLNEIRLELKGQTELPEGMDEAAREYSKKCYCPILKHKDGIGLNCSEIETALKAGAEWQKDKMLKLIETRISEIIGDAQPNPVLRIELQDIIDKIK